MAFLRNSRVGSGSGSWDELVAELASAAMEIAKHPLLVLLFVGGGAWILIRGPVAEGVIEEDGEFACRRRNGFGFADACREPAIERPQRGTRPADVDGSHAQQCRGTTSSVRH